MPAGLLAPPGLLANAGLLAPSPPPADVSSMTDEQLASYTASLIGDMPEPSPALHAGVIPSIAKVNWFS
jgi:hypothetical protein